MGTTARFLVVPVDVDVRQFVTAPARSLSSAGRRQFVEYELDKTLSPDALEGLATALSVAGHCPVLAFAVDDSGVGFITAVDATGEPARHVVNPTLLEDYGYGSDSRPSTGQREMTPARLAWVPRAPSGFDLDAFLGSEWTFAEDAWTEFLRLVGLDADADGAAFEGATYLSAGGVVIDEDDTEIDLDRARYVYGAGTDFIGIWDRQRPGPPIARFSDDDAGHEAAMTELLRLIRSHPDAVRHRKQGG